MRLAEEIGLNNKRVEEQLCTLPLAQYAWARAEDIRLSERIRYVCRTECPMYGKSRACPPAVGTVEECREKCRRFEHALLITTVTEAADITGIKLTLDN